MKKTIPTTEIKVFVKNLTGYDVSVRKGKGSMKGLITVYLSLGCTKKGFTFKPFEAELRKLFSVDMMGFDVVTIREN